MISATVAAALIGGVAIGRHWAVLKSSEPSGKTAAGAAGRAAPDPDLPADGPPRRVETADGTTPHRDAATPSDSNPPPLESFEDWLNRYRAEQGDLARLRGELETAIARLPGAQDQSDDAAAALDALRRAEQTAGDDYAALVEQADQFLETYSTGPLADEARQLFKKYSNAWDDHEYQAAREFSKSNPDRFVSRIARYEQYLERHGAGGQHTADARVAIDLIRSEWAAHDYRTAYEFSRRYPNDLTALAERLRRFLDEHPSSRHRRAAEKFLADYEKAVAPGEYRVKVVSGRFDRSIARSMTNGPDLAVEIEVAGIRIGRTPIVRNTFTPIWNYEYPQTIRWRLGDPVTIRVIEFDFKNRPILTVESAEDPIALRHLTGTLDVQGHHLTFECNFAAPTLPALATSL